MNFAELKTELYARGTDYLSEDGAGVTRAERWLNESYREIINLHTWPFMVSTATGTVGSGIVVIPDFRRALVVTDSNGNKLDKVRYEEIVGDRRLPTETGTPREYWIDGTTVHGFPVGDTITVRYVKRAPVMTGTDQPAFLDEYHDLIIDGAMMRAYNDSDNYEAAAALKQHRDAGLSAMAEDYQVNSRDLSYIQVDPYDG